MPFQNNILKLIDHLSINIGKITFGGLQNVIRGKYIVNPAINSEKDLTFVDQNIQDLEDSDSSNTTAGSESQTPSDVTILPADIFISNKPENPESLETRKDLEISPMPLPPSISSPSITIKEENYFGEKESRSEISIGDELNNLMPSHINEPIYPPPQVPPLDPPSFQNCNSSGSCNHHHHHHHHSYRHFPPKDDNSTSTSTAATTTGSATSGTTTTTETTASQGKEAQANSQKRNLRRLQSKNAPKNKVNNGIEIEFVDQQESRDDDTDGDEEVEDSLINKIEVEDSKDNNETVENDDPQPSAVPMVTLVAKGVKYCGKEGGGINDLGDLSQSFSSSIAKLFNISRENVLIIKMSLINNSTFVNCTESNSKQEDNKMDVKFTFL